MPAMASAMNWLTSGLPRPMNRGVMGAGGGSLGLPPQGLEAASMRRRLATWVPANVHVNTLMRQAGPTVVARAR